MTRPEFSIECYQNEFLPEGADMVHAVLTVTAGALDTRAAPAASSAQDEHGRSELIILDTSGSMFGSKLHEAKAATASVIESLPDGVRFGVLCGSAGARVVFPGSPPLAVASAKTRRDALKALRRVTADGGTAMGTWITLAAEILRDEPGFRHAILLTDGKNESESPEDLQAALASAEGAFQCDCRGVGADWDPAELKLIASRLLGSYDIVARPAELAADFASMLSGALTKQIPEVTLRTWAPQGAEIVLLKELDVLTDLNAAPSAPGAQTRDYSLGAWGEESRDYHLSVRVVPGAVDDEMLACRISLVADGEVIGQALARAVWTDDVARSTRINPRVALAMGEGELAAAIQDGVDAHKMGDEETATACFGRAVKLASEHGNVDALNRLATVVEIDDPATGLVRPKATVDKTDVLIVETRSVRTVRSKP